MTDRDPKRVDDRYEVLELLGRGGMGSVYRVRERASGAELALKRLDVRRDRPGIVELFEQEFHTLTQLAHPRVVRVHGYGRDGNHPYYTLELLDGGDLKSHAPLPWRQACAVAYEVCSALSLLHSRGLVHRDLTPTNIRLSSDGQAKIIDFGLLSPFGPPSVVAGTPPYVAPEVVLQQSLDARSDLFTFGATLYHALTGRAPFKARRMTELRNAWRNKPEPPSRFAPDVPPALDALVASLLRIDAGSRPKSAGEVMARLRPLLAQAPAAELEAAGAHLTAPKLIGREEALTRMRKQVLRSTRRRGGGFLISGPAGVGRSRMLDAFVLDAKLIGAATARAGARDAASGPFGVARALVEQLHAAAPLSSIAAARKHPEVFELLFGSQRIGSDLSAVELLDVARAGFERAAVHRALRSWLQELARDRLVALAVDDLEQVDGPSASLLAALTLGASELRLAYAMAASSEQEAASLGPRAVIAEQARALALEPLSPEQTRSLLGAVFGDVPNLQALSTQLQAIGGGMPGRSMALAQQLVDQGAIRYEGGAWALPAELDRNVLPTDLERALVERVATLPDDALQVGRLLALSVLDGLTRAQLAALAGLDGAAVDDAVDILRRAQLLSGTAAGYALRGADARAALLDGLDAETGAHLHDALGERCAAAGEPALVVAHHRLRGGDPRGALDALLAVCDTVESRTAVVQDSIMRVGGKLTIEALALAHELEKALERGPIGLCRLEAMLAGTAAGGQDARYYHAVREPWLARLKDESGFHDWHALGDEPDPMTRALKAFGAANERHEARPPEQRGHPPADAIKEMVSYVVFSIAVGARTYDLGVTLELPSLLEPFEVLNPLVRAMKIDAEGARESGLGRRETATRMFRELIAELDAMEGVELAYVERIRAALWQAVALAETAMGMTSDALEEESWQQDPSQQVGAEYIRKIAALHRGDWEAAEQHRRQAELLALETLTGSMFTTHNEELEAHAFARDLTGTRSVRQRIHDNARAMPMWQFAALLADAHYFKLCGELERALEAVEAGRQLAAERGIESRSVLDAAVVEVEALLELGRAHEALDRGRAALERCERDGRRHARRLIACSTALAEATLGQHAAARARVREVIEEQHLRGITGLLLGRSHEYLARIAIMAGDREAYEASAAAAAIQYRVGTGSMLGALYERLVEAARGAGLVVTEGPGAADATGQRTSTLVSHVLTTLLASNGERARARAAVALLCDVAKTSAGHLFLLTEAGLTHAASSRPAGNLKDLQTHAQGHLELELDDDVCTVTAELMTGFDAREPSVESGTLVEDDEGTRYRALSLRASVGSEHYILGVALLGMAEDAAFELGTVSVAIARHLYESGDYRPLAAA